RGRLVEAVQLAGQPPVAAVGHNGQRHVHIDVEAHLTGQAVEVKEGDADAEAVFDAVPLGIADNQVAGRLGDVVGQEQRRLVPTEPGHRYLPNLPVVATQVDPFLPVADGLVAALGNVDDGLVPGGRRESTQAPQDGRATAADGHQGDVPLV